MCILCNENTHLAENCLTHRPDTSAKMFNGNIPMGCNPGIDDKTRKFLKFNLEGFHSTGNILAITMTDWERQVLTRNLRTHGRFPAVQQQQRQSTGPAPASTPQAMIAINAQPATPSLQPTPSALPRTALRGSIQYEQELSDMDSDEEAGATAVAAPRVACVTQLLSMQGTGHIIQPTQPQPSLDKLQNGKASITRLGAKQGGSGISSRYDGMPDEMCSRKVTATLVDSGRDCVVLSWAYMLQNGLPYVQCHQEVQGMGDTPAGFTAEIPKERLIILLGKGTPAEVRLAERILVSCAAGKVFDILLGTPFTVRIGDIIDYWGHQLFFRSERKPIAKLHSIPRSTLHLGNRKQGKNSAVCTVSRIVQTDTGKQ